MVLLLHPSMNKGDKNPITYLHYLMYDNSFQLNIGNEIDKSDLKIVWENFIDSSNYSDLVIYEHGKTVNQIPFAKGKQQLLVFYKNSYIGRIEQYKEVKEQVHQYLVKLSSRNNTIFFNGEVYGPTPYNSPAITVPNIASL